MIITAANKRTEYDNFLSRSLIFMSRNEPATYMAAFFGRLITSLYVILRLQLAVK